MKAQSVTENCLANFRERNHVCFGISPFNSYFSESKIRSLAEWGKREFKSMHFFVPDVPSSFTLEALGYDLEKASWKARRQCQYLFNKIQKAVCSTGYSPIQAQEMILKWENLSSNPKYVKSYEEAKGLFESDPIFREECIAASRWVIEKRVEEPKEITQKMLSSAARYLLTELPLFIDTAGIIGQESSVFCYHECIPFIEKLMRGAYRFSISKNQGFVVIEDYLSHPFTTSALSLPSPA